MSPEDLKFLWNTLSSFGVGALVSGAVVWVTAKHYAFPYLGRKAQNLADKEDIKELTHQVEQVKRQHAEILETVKVQNQLRMAAVDRRLQAHQEAFGKLRELVKYGQHPKIATKVADCEEWWEKNCLYLEPKAREAFNNAYWAASVHQTLVQASQFQMNWSPEQVKQNIENMTANWSRVLKALDVVLESVALPPLTQNEVKTIEPTADA